MFTEVPKFTFTSKEVQKWLKQLNPNKAAGPNNISPRVYQRLSSVLALPLYRLYTRMLKTGQWPKQWRQSAVCPIYKKKDPAVFTNYRPISLLDILTKTFETQLARHLTKNIIHCGYLPEEQYGFRTGHSCSDLVYSVLGTAMTAINDKRDVSSGANRYSGSV